MRIILFIASSILLFSCNYKKQKISREEDIINDVFLSVVDTSAYSYFSLIPYGIEKPANKNIGADSFLIAFDTNLTFPTEWLKSARIALDENSKDSSYHNLLNTTPSNLTRTIQLENIKNTGRFKLTNKYNFKQTITGEGLVGVLRFSTFFFNKPKSKALCIVEIRDNVKSARWELLLFQTKNEKWEILNRLILAQS